MTARTQTECIRLDYLTPTEISSIREIVPLEKPVNEQVFLPGGKEDTNRALILGAISDGLVLIDNVSLADDSVELMEALIAFGVEITVDGRRCTVQGTSAKFEPCKANVYTGISGTSSRFLTGLSMLVPGQFVLDSGPRMRERPMADLINAGSNLGANIRCLQSDDHFPILFSNGSSPFIKGGKIKMSGENSSQFFTSLLLVGSRFANGLEIEVVGNQVSRSYIDMTQHSLAQYGVRMINANYQRYLVPKTDRISCKNYFVECDATAATYFMGIAAITGSRIRIENLSVNSPQGDARFHQYLEQMGCIVSVNADERWIEVVGPKELVSCRVDMLSTPDSAQTLAVIAAFAKGTSRITGLQTLRFKETDRLKALETELSRMGIRVQTGVDWIEVEGGKPHGAWIKTYEDHRMAMSFAIAGAAIHGVRIAGADTVTKSFPEFWATLNQIGVITKLND
ncbi:3-phosphoshikimate 1-carboxyvinyltransferase [Flavobacterium sp.]|jgi:3-phosphoshikimate 1-carboxyvinyltransferase|uniref:3-phosphoshikimate 1-carboxyvinyltransferase n=1 Tax=Flavobacterium sp. TaxID=239 RepID=UPI0037BEFC94